MNKILKKGKPQLIFESFEVFYIQNTSKLSNKST
jgi:hypothetical protein